MDRVALQSRPEELIELCNKHSQLLDQFRAADPEFADAISTRDLPKIRSMQMQKQLRESKRKYDEGQLMLTRPDDESVQKRIEERIRLENIQENMVYAMENFPESYGGIVMLYIHAELNSVPIKAFVDSGAQMTVMSVSFAKKCNLMRLVDSRYQGEARGVGSSKIVGKIHVTQVRTVYLHIICIYSQVVNIDVYSDEMWQYFLPYIDHRARY
jgi:DNA damage-inducible protein 1